MNKGHNTMPKIPDLGCEWNPVADGCVNCPFPKCKHDMTAKEILAMRNSPQQMEIVARYEAMIDAGTPPVDAVASVAREFKVGIRQVYRLKQKWLDSDASSKPKPRVQCSLDNCDNPLRARGFCSKHLYRYNTHGDPLMVKNPGRKRVSTE